MSTVHRQPVNPESLQSERRHRPTIGAVLHAAALYDLLVWFATLGKDRTLRAKVLQLAGVSSGESVLDVGCGTGNLALAAKRHVGTKGTVYGVDASVEMVKRARKKATMRGLGVLFENGIAQKLPFPDAQFDVVLSTRALHHLPRVGREECIGEMRRVLKPNGRVLVVDFVKGAAKRGFLARLHRHGSVTLEDVIALVRCAGFRGIESGPVGIGSLGYVLANVSQHGAAAPLQ